MKNKLEEKNYNERSKLLSLIIAIELICIVAMAAYGIHSFINYKDYTMNIMIRKIERQDWNSLLSFYSSGYNPDKKYSEEELMVLATAEYYDHASLHAAAVYAGDTSSAEREKKYMDEAYEQMGIYQECKQDIDEYISNMGN